MTEKLAKCGGKGGYVLFLLFQALFAPKLPVSFRVAGEERQWGAGGDISASVRIDTARLGGTTKLHSDPDFN